ncbi:uncharacterized protein LOC133885934 [Phragmites australis]|uniref:uncharacterized protein LOC133885934 n=1 Tax=Phragmites australis TaxID=29695 RepID=UPI002D78DE14|nr:uncharacterized protein LOC133885934 [Phragmites australis]
MESGSGPASSPRRVVVAVDESEESMHALNWCLTNVVSAAPASKAPPPAVVLVHARPPRPLYPAIDGAGYALTQHVVDSMDQYFDKAADAVVAKARSICTAFPDVQVEARVERGDARDVICSAAEKAGADMLVIGSHGHGFFQRALLGSVSNHCVQNCRCPVVVVKRPDTGDRQHGS